MHCLWITGWANISWKQRKRVEKGILQRLRMASYAESDATLKDFKIPSIIATKGKILNFLKLKWPCGSNKLGLSLYYFWVYPVPSSTGRKTERWYTTSFHLKSRNEDKEPFQKECNVLLKKSVLISVYIIFWTNRSNLDLDFHWVLTYMHLTKMGHFDWLITVWIINEFEKLSTKPEEFPQLFLSRLICTC